MATGVVRYFNASKGFGLITPDDAGPCVFAHTSSIRTPGVKSLKAADRVEFDISTSETGTAATNIRRLP